MVKRHVGGATPPSVMVLLEAKKSTHKISNVSYIIKSKILCSDNFPKHKTFLLVLSDLWNLKICVFWVVRKAETAPKYVSRHCLYLIW